MSNKTENILNYIQNIEKEEGSNFDFDQEAILQSYQKQGEGNYTFSMKFLSILGGFLATCTFIAFLTFAQIFESATTLFIVGMSFFFIAIWLNKKNDHPAVESFCISLFIAAFPIIGFAFFKFGLKGENDLYLIFIILSLISVYFTQNYLISFVSIIIIFGSFLAILLDFGNKHLIHIYNLILPIILTFWYIKEAKIITFNKKLAKLYLPTRIALIIAALFGLFLVCCKLFLSLDEKYLFISSCSSIVCILYLLDKILDKLEIQSKNQKNLFLLLSIVFLAVLTYAPAILGAILIILLSFYVNFNTGLAIGIIALMYFTAQYYYDLSFTLLQKSLIMLFLGVFFLVIYFFINKNFKQHD